MIYTINNLFMINNKKNKKIPKKITVNGWIRSHRISKQIGFLDLNDGSSINNLQIIYNPNLKEFKNLNHITTGSAITVIGNLILTPKAKQPLELKLIKYNIYNICSNDYPIQKKQHTNEFLRENSHLRVRTNTFLALFRIRNQLSRSIHNFFQNNKFIYLHSPIITSNDAEGAGENFIVTTINNNKYENDFFGKKALLTVSGQLNAEAYAQSLQKVYTFGPTFRAEYSNTTRHASEFWMVEPEFTFSNLKKNITLAQKLVKTVIKDIIKKCYFEIYLLQKKQNTKNKQTLLEKLEKISDFKSNFKILTYTEAIELLLNAQKENEKFIFNKIKWGIDLKSEHEKYLCEKITKQPTFIINYPQKIKSFYMKVNPIDNNYPKQKTVAAMDLLVPGIGELIGGSVREDNYEQLIKNKNKFKIENNDLQWYFDLRKYGYAPSAGFGLGFERLLMLITGINNIKDVIPFPRTPNNLLF